MAMFMGYWQRFSEVPGLARILIAHLNDDDIIPAQLPTTDARITTETVNAAAEKRSDAEAIAECYLNHVTGACPLSQLNKYVTADFTFETST